MTVSKKSVAAALAALTVGATLVAADPAEARWRGRGWGVGAGVVGALAVGGLLAAAASRPAYGYYEPVYVGSGPVRRCHIVDRVNYYGEVIGQRRVCRTYY